MGYLMAALIGYFVGRSEMVRDGVREFKRGFREGLKE